MTQETWKNGVSGTWSTASDWVGGVPDSSTADATIAAAGAYTVTLAAATTDIVDSVELNDSTANFDLLGTLDLGGTLATYTFDGRNFILGSTGELSGGTLDIDSGTLVNQGGTLATSDFILGSGATIALGGKALTIGNNAQLQGLITGGNASGSALVITGNAALYEGLELENRATLVIAGTLTESEYYSNYNYGLNLGSGPGDTDIVQINAGAVYDLISDGSGADITDAYSGGSGTVINAGLIDSNTSGNDNYIDAALISTGTIESDTGDLQLQDGGTLGGKLTGAGEIDFNGGSFTLSPSISISVAVLGFEYGTVTTGGSLNLSGEDVFFYSGQLDLGGGLSLASGTSFYNENVYLNGHNLTLASPGFSGGGGFFGPGTVVLTGTASSSGFDLGGGAELVIAGTLVQSQYYNIQYGYYGLSLGSGPGDTDIVQINSGAVYDLISDGYGADITDIIYGSSGTVINAGLIDSNETGGNPNYIDAVLNSTGTIESDTGDLQLQQGGTIGGKLTGAGEIDFNGGSFTLSPSISISVAVLGFEYGTVTTGGSLNLSGEDVFFYSGQLDLGGGLSLASGTSFYNENVYLNGHNLTLASPGFSGGGGFFGAGTVVLTGTASSSGFDLENGAELVIAGTLVQSQYYNIQYGYYGLSLGSGPGDTDIVQINSGAVYDLISDGYGADITDRIYGGSGTVINAGLIDSNENAGYPNYIDAALISTGTIESDTGDLQLQDGGTIGGKLTGAGEIDFDGGNFTLSPSISISVAVLGFEYGTVTTGGSLNLSGEDVFFYSGQLALGGGLSLASGVSFNDETVYLNGHNLTLASPGFSGGGGFFGPGTVVLTGTASSSGFNLENGAELVIAGTLVQSQYYNIQYGYYGLSLGSGPGDTDIVQINSGAVYDLISDGYGADITDIIYGSSGTVINAGLIDSNENAGYPNYIDAALISTGTIESDTGDLQLQDGGTIGGKLTGAGEIDFDGGVFTLSPSLTINVGELGVFNGTVALGANLSYAGFLDIQEGELELNGHSLISSGGSYLGIGAILVGAGTLKVAGQNELSGFNLTAGAVLEDAGTITQTGNLQLGLYSGDSATLQIDAGAVYDDQAQGGTEYGIYSGGNGSIVNAGLLEFTGYWDAGQGEVQPNIKNTGTILETGNGLDFIGTLVNDGVLTLTSAFGNNGGAYTTESGAILADSGKTGTIVIGADSFLDAASSVTGQDIVFTTSGTLAGGLTIGSFGSFAGTISGFATGDFIDLSGVLANNFSYANNILTLSEISNGSTTAVGSLALASGTGTIGLASDGAGGTYIILNNPGTSYSNPLATTTQSNWNGASAAWTTAADWSPHSVPGTLAVAVFDTGGNYTVSYATTDAVFQLYVDDAGAKLAMSSGKLTVEDGGAFYGTLALTGGTFDAANGYTFSGPVTQGPAGTLQVDTGPLDIQGNAVLAGAIMISTNVGWVEFGGGGGGNVTLNTGFSLQGGEIAQFLYSAVTLGASQTIAIPAQFSLGSLDLNSHTLSLSGSSFFSDSYQLEGAGTLAITGTAQIDGLDMTGNAKLLVSGLTEQEGAFNVGSGADNSSVSIASTGIYDFADDGAADTLGDAGTGSLVNAGLLEVAGYGNDTESIYLPVINTGTLLVTEGGLQLDGGGTLSGALAGAGGVDLGGGTFTLTSLTASITALNMFDGDIVLGSNLSYAGAFTDTDDDDTIALNSHSMTLAGQGNLNDVIEGPGTLKVTGTVDAGNEVLTGGAVLEDAGTLDLVNLTIGENYYDSATVNIDAGATLYFDFAGDAEYYGGNYYGGDSGGITNKGLINANGGGTASIELPLTNASTGTIEVTSGTLQINGTFSDSGLLLAASGADLQLQSGGSLAGTLGGAGEIDLASGAFTLSPSLVIAVETLGLLSGSTVSLARTALTIAGSVFVAGGNLAPGTGETLTLSGPVSLGYGNTATFSGPGTLLTSGTTSIADDGASPSLYLQGGINWVNGGIVNDAGDIQWGSYYDYLNGGVYDNLTNMAGAVFDLISDDAGVNSDYNGYYGDSAAFTNAGTLEKTGGSGGTSTFEMAIYNTGTINVANGTLNFTDGGSLGGLVSGAGTVGFGGGSTTLLSGITLSVASVQLSGGTLAFASSLSYKGPFQQSGGILALGTGQTLTLSGAVSLGYGNAATFSGPGTLLTSGTTSIADDGASPSLYLQGGINWVNGGTVNDAGDIQWGSYNDYLNGGVADNLTNKAGAVFDLISDDAGVNSDYNGYYGDSAAFTNAGTLEKTGGDGGTSTFDMAIYNTGTINVANGTLNFSDGGSLGGSFATSGTGVLEFGGGTFGIAATTATIACGVLVAGGNLAPGTGQTLTLSGPVSLGSGNAATFSGPGTLLTSAMTSIADNGPNPSLYLQGGIDWVNGGTVNDAGVIQWGSYNDYLNGGVADNVTNKAGAVFDLISDDAGVNSAYDEGYGNSATFTNAGTLEKTGGSGGISTFYMAINNTGTIDVANGTLYLDDGISNDTNGTLAGGTWEAAVSGTVTGTLELSQDPAITTDAADIILSGIGAEIITGVSTPETIEASLVSISAAGTLQNLAGHTYSSSNTLTNAGAIILAGGLFKPAKIANTGSISGYGTIGAAVQDTGTITASGGTLTFSGTVTGTGGLGAVAGATVDLTTGGGLTEKISGAGTLKLDGATAYTLAAGATAGVADVQIDAGATLSGAGTLGGAVSDAGTLAATSGTFVVDGAVTGGGVLTAASGAILDLAGGGSFTGGINGAGTLRLDGSNPFTLQTGGTLGIAAVVADAGAILDLTRGGTLGGSISGAGTLQLDGATPYTLAGAALGIAALTVDSGVTVSGHGSIASAVANGGTIAASGGKLVLSGQVTGSGVLQAATSSVLDLTAGETLNEAVSGAGTLELGGTFLLGSGALSVATVSIDAGALLSGAGTLTSIADAGTLAAAGGTLTVNGKISGAGTLAAGSGAVLNVAGGGSFSGNLGGLGTVDIAKALTLTTGAILSAATIDETAKVTLGASTALSLAVGSALDITAASGTTVELSGPSTANFTNNGSILGNGAGTAELDVAVINNANVSVGSGTLSFLSSLTNNGTIDAAAGTLSVKDTVGGTGTLQIGATGTMSLLLGAGTGQTADFLASTGLLDLTKPIDFKGVITGFGGSDVIDLLKAPETSYSFSNNVLTIKNGTTTEASLHFSSGYTLADFSVASDLNGGTFVKFV